MNVLVLIKNKLVRDQVVVGLQNFPEFAIDLAEGFPGINKMRQKKYDAVFIGDIGNESIGGQMLERLREFDQETDVIVVADPKKARLLGSSRSKLNLLAILQEPLDVDDFFRLVARLRRKELAES